VRTITHNRSVPVTPYGLGVEALEDGAVFANEEFAEVPLEISPKKGNSLPAGLKKGVINNFTHWK